MFINEEDPIVWSKVFIVLEGETYYPVSAIGQLDLAGKNMLTWIARLGLTARLGNNVWGATRA